MPSCQPRDYARSSPSLSARSRTQTTNRKTVIGDASVSGVQMRVLANVRLDRPRYRDEFDNAKLTLGLDCIRLQGWGRTVTFDVAGTVEALETFTNMACVASWEYALDTRKPRETDLSKDVYVKALPPPKQPRQRRVKTFTHQVWGQDQSRRLALLFQSASLQEATDFARQYQGEVSIITV